MLIGTAYAQTAGGGSPTDLFTALAPMLVIVGIFYFLLLRPQQKKAKEHKEKLAGIRRGDRIVTGGGLIGTVSKVVGDNELMVEIAQGVRVSVIRSTVAEILGKSDPATRSQDKKPASGKPAEEAETASADTGPAKSQASTS
ncbi:MAG: preprotein translocase subunit YajC [Alphaproteobacteria bacterium]|nr:preprotein translocase subunit YajC [Alphaproteobacteria bacterium]